MWKHRTFPPQLVTGVALTKVPVQKDPEELPTYSEVIRNIALDLQQTLTRKGRAPFIFSGVPMFKDLCAIQQNLEQCLSIRADTYLRCWHEALSETLPQYQNKFGEVEQTVDWIDGIRNILDIPLPTDDHPGLCGDEVAQQLAHYLGFLDTIPDLSTWQISFRQDLFARSESYWSGLFHCYDIPGLPRTNNKLESLYGQTKRQIRRQLGISELREPLLRRAAWIVLEIDVDSPTELQNRFAQVSWDEYANERIRYEQRQNQFHRRYRWRHHRDTVLQQRVADWTKAVPDT